MNLKGILATAGAAYAIGRLTANLTGDDVRVFGERIRSLSGDDVRRYMMGLTDDALDRAGLVRRVNVPNGAAMMVGGLGAGILVGAGLALLFAPQSGRDTRAFIGDKVRHIRTNNGQTETSPETTGGGTY